MKKKMLVRIALAAWIVIWVLFLVRPYFKKGLFKDYASLSRLSIEAKRAHVTGKDLYYFIKFCKESIKEPSTYNIAGLENYSLEHRRARYYLYPDIEQSNPEFIFVYKIRDFKRQGYHLFKTFDPEKYILRKI